MATIWIADIKKLKPELDQLSEALPPEDREKVMSFRRMEDRLRCAVGRTMIRALAAMNGMPRAQLVYSAYGKPAFDSGAPQFCLSHSGDWVVLSAGDMPIGVDVEKRDMLDWESMSRFYDEREKEMLRTDIQPLRCFYRIWTVKEAFAKEDGRGLSLFEQENIRIDYVNKSAAWRGRNLSFRTWETQEYTLSFCSEEAPLQPQFITAEEWQALRKEGVCPSKSKNDRTMSWEEVRYG